MIRKIGRKWDLLIFDASIENEKIPLKLALYEL